MARKFMADMKTSRRLSRPEATTAMEPDMSPTKNLLAARPRAQTTAKMEAFCFMSIAFP